MQCFRIIAEKASSKVLQDDSEWYFTIQHHSKCATLSVIHCPVGCFLSWCRIFNTNIPMSMERADSEAEARWKYFLSNFFFPPACRGINNFIYFHFASLMWQIDMYNAILLCLRQHLWNLFIYNITNVKHFFPLKALPTCCLTFIVDAFSKTERLLRISQKAQLFAAQVFLCECK